jgi:hypothetical protein
MVCGGLSCLTNTVVETLDMKSCVYSLVTVMFVTLNASSQSAVLHSIVFTALVKGLRMTPFFLLSSAYSRSPLKTDPEFSSLNPEHILYSSLFCPPVISQVISAFFRPYVGIQSLKVCQNVFTNLNSICWFSGRNSDRATGLSRLFS